MVLWKTPQLLSGPASSTCPLWLLYSSVLSLLPVDTWPLLASPKVKWEIQLSSYFVTHMEWFCHFSCRAQLYPVFYFNVSLISFIHSLLYLPTCAVSVFLAFSLSTAKLGSVVPSLSSSILSLKSTWNLASLSTALLQLHFQKRQHHSLKWIIFLVLILMHLCESHDSSERPVFPPIGEGALPYHLSLC